MSTTYINSLFENKRPQTLDEATEYSSSESTFIHLLEFDEEIFAADLKSTCEFYSGLLQSGNYVLHENVLDSIAGFINNAILTISNFFQYIFRGAGAGKENKSFADYEKRINSLVKILAKNKEEFMKDFKNHEFSEKNGKIITFKRPSGFSAPTVANVIGNNVEKLNEIMKQCTKIFDDIKSKALSGDAAKEAIKKLIEDEKALIGTIAEFNVVAPFVSEEHEGNLGEYAYSEYSYIDNGSFTKFIEEKKNKTISSFPEFKSILDTLDKAKHDVLANEHEDLAVDIRTLTTTHVELAKSITDKFQNYCLSMYSSIYSELKFFYGVVKKLLDLDEEDEGDVTDECAIFENVMYSEMAAYRWECMEIYREGIIKEALIKSDEKLDTVFEMQCLNEAVSTKIADAFKKMIAKLKELIRRFMEKLRANFTTTRHYLDKYKKVLLQYKVPDQAYQGDDILNGMDRILRFELPNFNYNDLKNNNLNDRASFFSYITGNIDKTNFKSSVEIGPGKDAPEDIGNWFKEYFGIANPEVTVSGAAVQNRIKDIYDFMYDISKIERSVNKTLGSIEKMRDEVFKQAKIAPAQESYFSFIDNIDYLIEAINGVNPTQTQQSANGNTTNNVTYSNMTGRVADNTSHVAPGTTDANGKVQYGVDNTVDLEDLDNRCKVYTDVVTKVLQAKLTAIEALRNDFMYIFRKMVNLYIGDEAQTTGQTATNTKGFMNKNPHPQYTGDSTGSQGTTNTTANQQPLTGRAARQAKRAAKKAARTAQRNG